MAELTLEQIQTRHDKAYNHGQEVRDRASDDMVFAWVTQWDDTLLAESQLQYRGEFNILRKAMRDIIGQLRANTFQVDFEPVDSSRDDAAEIADGLYRAIERKNSSIEAYNNAMQESIVCGYGAWELYTSYETNEIGEDKQVINRRPLFEANNNVYWDPNSQLLDRSDARYCSVLAAYSEDGFREEVARLTGMDEDDVDVTSFAMPNQSYSFPWVCEDGVYYIARFYQKEVKQERNYLLRDPFGSEMTVRDFEFNKIEDEAIDAGFEIIEEYIVNRDVVTLYYVTGNEILDSFRVAGSNIPVIPFYGESQYIEGQMNYEGVVRCAKDPQRLRNFIMSYVADIAGRSPRPKPIFTKDQIAGYEFMYNETGADDNYPYRLQNAYDANGNPNPIGPVSTMPDAPIPQSVAALIDLTRQAVDDVANPGIPQDIADTDLSGKAVRALQAKIDDQWYIYRDNYKHAKRRDGEVWASMASEVYDSPRRVTLEKPDGSRKRVQMLEAVVDKETGEIAFINDISGADFEVYADIGHSYANKREETLDRLAELSQEAIAGGDPATSKMLFLKRLQLIDGTDLKGVKDYARKQLIMMGFENPETDEEKAMMAQLQQAQGQNANDTLARAEAEARLMEGQAAMIDKQTDQFNAETKRMEAIIKAEKTGADMRKIEAEIAKTAQEIRSSQIDSIKKLSEPFRVGA